MLGAKEAVGANVATWSSGESTEIQSISNVALSVAATVAPSTPFPKIHTHPRSAWRPGASFLPVSILLLLLPPSPFIDKVGI